MLLHWAINEYRELAITKKTKEDNEPGCSNRNAGSGRTKNRYRLWKGTQSHQ